MGVKKRYKDSMYINASYQEVHTMNVFKVTPQACHPATDISAVSTPPQGLFYYSGGQHLLHFAHTGLQYLSPLQQFDIKGFIADTVIMPVTSYLTNGTGVELLAFDAISMGMMELWSVQLNYSQTLRILHNETEENLFYELFAQSLHVYATISIESEKKGAFEASAAYNGVIFAELEQKVCPFEVDKLIDIYSSRSPALFGVTRMFASSATDLAPDIEGDNVYHNKSGYATALEYVCHKFRSQVKMFTVVVSMPPSKWGQRSGINDYIYLLHFQVGMCTSDQMLAYGTLAHETLCYMLGAHEEHSLDTLLLNDGDLCFDSQNRAGTGLSLSLLQLACAELQQARCNSPVLKKRKGMTGFEETQPINSDWLGKFGPSKSIVDLFPGLLQLNNAEVKQLMGIGVHFPEPDRKDVVNIAKLPQTKTKLYVPSRARTTTATENVHMKGIHFLQNHTKLKSLNQDAVNCLAHNASEAHIMVALIVAGISVAAAQSQSSDRAIVVPNLSQSSATSQQDQPEAGDKDTGDEVPDTSFFSNSSDETLELQKQEPAAEDSQLPA